MTDDLLAYLHLGKTRDHRTVCHSRKEYVDYRPDEATHVNTAEAIHSYLKRAVLGVWHWISQKHLARYLAELSFRYATRLKGHTLTMVDFLSRQKEPIQYVDMIAPDR